MFNHNYKHLLWFSVQRDVIYFKLYDIPWYMMSTEKQLIYLQLLNQMNHGATLQMGPFGKLNFETFNQVIKPRATNKCSEVIKVLWYFQLSKRMFKFFTMLWNTSNWTRFCRKCCTITEPQQKTKNKIIFYSLLKIQFILICSKTEFCSDFISVEPRFIRHSVNRHIYISINEVIYLSVMFSKFFVGVKFREFRM